MKMAAEILDEGGNTYLTQSYRFYNLAVSYMCTSALPQTYPKIVKCLYNLVVSISISQPLRYYNSAIPQTYPRIKKIKYLYFKMLN
ncbi:unnamed protein product [Brassica oleracea]|uniref:(rape) hypothetical protein n=1 Tax=Brassica napus TaxID=3708 RepID=A0A816LPN8_BRANA|nr:unnamed protein product [Brassica napus]